MTVLQLVKHLYLGCFSHYVNMLQFAKHDLYKCKPYTEQTQEQIRKHYIQNCVGD